jgi:hypothetical protein
MIIDPDGYEKIGMVVNGNLKWFAFWSTYSANYSSQVNTLAHLLKQIGGTLFVCAFHIAPSP